MMDYDLVILALPIAWLAIEGTRSHFMPWEKSLLVFAWLLPLFARSIATRLLIPVAPLAMLLLLADIAPPRRCLGDGSGRFNTDGDCIGLVT